MAANATIEVDEFGVYVGKKGFFWIEGEEDRAAADEGLDESPFDMISIRKVFQQKIKDSLLSTRVSKETKWHCAHCPILGFLIGSLPGHFFET